MTLKGEAARDRCRQAVEQLGDLIPSDVEVTVSGGGRNCTVMATRKIDLQSYLPSDGFRGAVTIPGGVHAESAVFGFGTWIPFLPSRLKHRLALVDVLERLQSAVSGALDSPWPGEGYTVRSASEDGRLRLWFENAEGQILPAVIFDDSTA